MHLIFECIWVEHKEPLILLFIGLIKTGE